MTFFVVYDPASGAIKRAGSCGPNDVAAQAQAGEAALATPALARDDKFKVDVTQKPPAVVAKGP